MRFFTITASLLSLTLPFCTFAEPHANPRPHHHRDLAHRARGDVNVHKRDYQFTNVRFTFYDVGLGACGQVNQPSDFIVALTATQFGGGYPGPFCFQMITIEYGGKTAQAQIMDECMGCPYGGLDFSDGLFSYFADMGEGVLTGSWSFNDGSDAPTTSSTWTPPSTTQQPTSTWSPPPTTSWTSTSTSTWSSSSSSSWSSSSSSSSSWSSSSTINVSTGAASGLAETTGSAAYAAPTDGPAVISNMNQAFVGVGAIIVAARQ